MNVIQSKCVDDSVHFAMKALDDLEIKFSKMYRGEIVEDVPMKYNKFLPLPLSMASVGVRTCLIKGDIVNGHTNIVYIPKNGKVKHHFHKAEKEILLVRSGNVNYRLYKTENYKEVLKGGILLVGETLTIESMISHYIFTTETEAYIKIDFITKK